ncbi:DUF4436 family protein [Streptomyces sp. NPDC032472]|uniref:DUF4436 family protein n=1 Tax=Streptomyces sp. NPDC032472 TaxID=3155018 RepID=UPI0034013A20
MLLTIAVLIVVAVGVGSWLQFSERQASDTVHTVGSSAADRVDVEAAVQRVDAAARELVLRVRVTPHGSLGDLAFKAHEWLATRDAKVAITGGSISDYPFDTYETGIGFRALLGGRQVPVRLLLSDIDTLFSVSATSTPSGKEAVLALGLARSGSLLVFAVFMMIVMWAPAASVLLGAWYLTTRGKGLVRPAMAWMAATLFALSAFRNTAPGTPPIGCVTDWFAFLWAETVTALRLIAAVIAGVRTALRSDETHPAWYFGQNWQPEPAVVVVQRMVGGTRQRWSTPPGHRSSGRRSPTSLPSWRSSWGSGTVWPAWSPGRSSAGASPSAPTTRRSDKTV